LASLNYRPYCTLPVAEQATSGDAAVSVITGPFHSAVSISYLANFSSNAYFKVL